MTTILKHRFIFSKRNMNFLKFLSLFFQKFFQFLSFRISLWDTEKERLVLLTKNFLFSIKYDLISLKILEYNKVSLMDVDTLIAGDLIYPSKSLLP